MSKLDDNYAIKMIKDEWGEPEATIAKQAIKDLVLEMYDVNEYDFKLKVEAL
jgi:hypothetical protein